MALTKVSGGILDPGINVAGIVTATGFDGPFIGGSDGINAGIITCTELDLNGNGNISGNLVVEGNLTANGDFTTLNTTLREVELLRVDANATVAAGIITQRGSGDIFSVYDTSTQVFKIADGGGVGISTAGGNIAPYGNSLLIRAGSTVGTNKGHIMLTGDSATVDQGPQIVFSESGSGSSYAGGSIGFERKGGNSQGDLIFGTRGTSGDANTTTTERLRITSAGQVQINTDGGSGALTLGASQDFKLYHDAGGPTIFSDTGNQGLKLQIKELNLTEYTGATTKLKIDSSGRLLVGRTSASNSDSKMEIQDSTDTYLRIASGNTGGSAGVIFGSSDDHSTGGIYYVNSDDSLQFAGYNNSTRLIIDSDGAVNIGSNPAQATGTNTQNAILTVKGYPGGNETSAAILALVRGYNTTSISANHTIGRIVFGDKQAGEYAFIEGEAEANGAVGDTPGRLVFSTAPDGTSAPTEKLRITSGGNLKLPDNAKIELGGAQTGAGDLEIYYDGTDGFINQKNNALKIQYNGTLKSYFGSNTFNLQDDYKLGLGDANDLQIYHTTSGTSWIRHTNSSEYFILEGNQIDFRDYATGVYRARMGTAVQLYYNGNNVKLSTTNTGITVTGEVAASQDYPNFRPTLDLNFTATKKLDSRITYTRTGPASFTNEFGKVILVGDNVPRFDHTFPEYWDEGTLGDSNSKGESRGLLIEESRTNIYKNNHNLTTANDHGSITQTVNTTETTAPDGTLTATKIAATGSDQWSRWDSNNGLDISTINFTDTFSTSIYMKTVGTSNVNVAMDFGDNGSKTFSVGQEWKRYAISAVHHNYGPTTKFIDLIFNGSVYIWGLQCENGAFPTSYIPTNGAAVTRGADTAFIDGEDFDNIYNDSEGTFVLQATTGDLSSSNQAAWGVEKASNRSGHFSVVGYRVGGGASGNTGAWYNANGSTSAFHNMNAGVTAETPFKIAFGYKLNDMDATTNGGTVLGDTSAAIDPDFDRFTLGSYHFGSMKIGHIQRAIYYSSKITDNQLKTLTS